jgi:hypothetical protein
VFVHRDAPAQPGGVWRRADEDEQRLGHEIVASPVRVSSITTASSADWPLSSTDLAVGHDLDLLTAFDLVEQISRHRLAEIAAANQQPAASDARGEKHRCLPGGVAAADDQHRVPRAQLRLDLGGAHRVNASNKLAAS